MNEEIWKPAVGMEGFYEVSSLGRVRSMERVVIRSNGRPNRVKERILKGTPNMSGYIHVTLWGNGKKIDKCIHILVAQAFIGPRPHGMEVAHFDGNQLNNSVRNLRYATPQENADDRIRHGTVLKGEGSRVSKLKEHQVIEILKDSRPHTEVALAYSVCEGTIRAIRCRKTWGHLGVVI